MVVLTKNYAIKKLSKKYDKVIIDCDDRKVSFICNKGFIRKNTNLVVIPKGGIIDQSSVLRMLFKKYHYKLKDGQVTSKFFKFNLANTDEFIIEESDCWVFKLKHLMEVKPEIKKYVEADAILTSLFLVRSSDTYSLANMKDLKEGKPFSKNKNYLKRGIIAPADEINFDNLDMRFYMIIGNNRSPKFQIQIGKFTILEKKYIVKTKSWIRQLFGLPAKTEVLLNNNPTYMALDKISNVISNVIKPFQIAIVGTISYNNVMINTIIDLKHGVVASQDLYKTIADLTGWYYKNDVITRF